MNKYLSYFIFIPSTDSLTQSLQQFNTHTSSLSAPFACKAAVNRYAQSFLSFIFSFSLAFCSAALTLHPSIFQFVSFQRSRLGRYGDACRRRGSNRWWIVLPCVENYAYHCSIEPLGLSLVRKRRWWRRTSIDTWMHLLGFTYSTTVLAMSFFLQGERARRKGFCSVTRI